MNSQQMAEALLQDLKRREELDLQTKELNKRIAKYSEDLYEQMEDDGVESIKIEGIEFKQKVEQDFTLKGDLKGQKWDEIGLWFKWLREVGEGGLIKTKESVPGNTRKKFLKDWVSEKKPLPDFVEEKFFNTVKYSKAKIKTMIELQMENEAGSNNQE